MVSVIDVSAIEWVVSVGAGVTFSCVVAVSLILSFDSPLPHAAKMLTAPMHKATLNNLVFFIILFCWQNLKHRSRICIDKKNCALLLRNCFSRMGVDYCSNW